LSQFYGESQTQPFSQVIYPPPTISYEVDDEETDDVWGYLVPVDAASDQYGILVLKERQSCEKDDPSASKGSKRQEKDKSEKEPAHSRGYLVGRHPECGELTASPENHKLIKQTLSSMFPPSRTVIS
jgi:serine/threonine-protein kinase Chk2